MNAPANNFSVGMTHNHAPAMTQKMANTSRMLAVEAVEKAKSTADQDTVLPLALPTVAIKAAHPDFWRKYVGRTGVVVGIASFGESAPAKDLYAHFGITAQRVVVAVRALVQRAAHNRDVSPPEKILVSSN